ncbi:MAG: SMC family ATPase [Acidimicrobiales bacterium]|nr:SMC family ATPase [Acidimicrobiales bacterium]
MRPVRIEMEGFAAFRQRVVVDFTRALETDTALFSLSGPTGSGKSSLIDAMIFALYGRIPRLGAQLVAPVISAGADRCRVRLDFEADGDVYTAVREVRRTATGGASVREARLQIGEQVLADGAATVTDHVQTLLGLGFDDFTRTVVLPQGKFARFLEATPGERQNLLRGLLGMDVYSKVRTLAGERRAAAQARADTASARLEALEVPPADAIEKLRGRVASLQEMETRAADWERELADLTRKASEAATEVERLADAEARLVSIEAPPRIEELADLVSAATTAVHEAEDALEKVTKDRVAAVEAAEDLPDAGTIQAWRRDRQEKKSLEEQLAALDPDPARKALDEAERAHARAEAGAREARERLDETRMGHAAHTLAAGLVVGEACPVCRQEVGALPELETLADLERLQAEVKAAGKALEEAREALVAARDAHTRIETDRSGRAARLADLEKEIADIPDEDELTRLEAAVAESKTRLDALRRAEDEARAAVEDGRRSLEALVEDQRALGRALREAQHAVADLKPPITESDDVTVQWKELLAWCEEKMIETAEKAGEARERAAEAESAMARRREEIASMLETHGVEAGESFLAAITRALERARHSLESAEKAVADAASLEEERKTGEAEAAVARALADHLRADGFEKWMMGGALRTLVGGANALLRELSDGGYSLGFDDEERFVVVDHRNADEQRPAATLSGGETFLVSLALALALAEIHAAHGEARLDAVILDEGFGTLDEETLDTVASLLEDLAGSRGLMVGVITHVKELAERAPIRFEVSRGPKGSDVREVA